MPFPTPLALLLPLAFAVSDAVPRFNIEPSCKGGLDSPGLNERYGRCISEENGARQRLESSWSTWPAGDRSQCTDTAKMGAPSYVELLTCLEMARDARKLKTKDGL
jgi:hypothetical protein